MDDIDVTIVKTRVLVLLFKFVHQMKIIYLTFFSLQPVYNLEPTYTFNYYGYRNPKHAEVIANSKYCQGISETILDFTNEKIQ